MPFSGGQESFSKFTMEMVRQYMKEEEKRAAHQSSLLRLRVKALKEKAKAELAWLEDQKRHLRDEGEDDKMPPIRKRQRDLLLRLQQEKAEIKRLQEANKAARKERQLILKEQAEIERSRQTAMKRQEKLKSAGENKLELHSEDDIEQSNGSSPLPTDAETRSPSPISISSSETSSIMQKLKEMGSTMDEKFLSEREQKLMQRRQHAEELLEWKRRLDAEEAEVRRIEKQALAAWDKELLKTKIAKKDLGDQRTEPKETTSAQSDIEGRIRALEDELRKRKSVVYQLKKEQAKRLKERLKAQEASLIKQLESYDEFIKKAEAELSRDPEASPAAKPQIKTPSSAATEKPKIKAPPLHRPETVKNWKSLAESERSRASLESISEHADTISSRTERSVSVYTKKVAVTEDHVEEPSGTSSSVLMSPRTSRAATGGSLDGESFGKPSKSAEGRAHLLSEQLFSQKEPSYLEDFEGSSRQQASVEEMLPEEHYKDDFEVSLLSPNDDARSVTAQSEHTQTSRSRSTSLGSDGGISEYLSDKSFSLSGSIHSERLLELGSPVEFMKNTERRDVEQEQLEAQLRLPLREEKSEDQLGKESPVFGASGQEELAKRLAELELNQEFPSTLGDDQDWFDEDYGLKSHKVPQKQAEEPAVLPKVEPQKVPAKPSEEALAIPHTAVEVEGMVHAAAEQLWKLKELGRDLQSCSLPMDLSGTLKEQDTDTANKQATRKLVFDLTREIFEEIFPVDPNLNQPVGMKPRRIASAYFRQVKDPNDLDEIKSFLAAEVLKLLSPRKEPNHKTYWQKMMKFGRKERDRVDQILVEELHEEEAQWVNYDEDEIRVLMQLVDGIFEDLLVDTIDALNRIHEKEQRLSDSTESNRTAASSQSPEPV